MLAVVKSAANGTMVVPKKEQEKIGIKRIKFSPEEINKFIDTANYSFLEDLEKKVPDEVKVIKKLLDY